MISSLTWLRWGVVVLLQGAILLLLWRQNVSSDLVGESDAVLKGRVVETGGDINGLYKTCE